ncbi:MAG: 2OG-Fe(II) oxygenase [Proteobacteria bacterium]|nr:2OG-Fe(II) oxygenase [Pseudomonadota bacterium]
MLDLDVIRRAPVTQEPFWFFQTPGVLDKPSLERISRDFPAITQPGVFSPDDLTFGPSFAELIDEIRGADLEAVLSRKFDVDLSELPLMVHIRGYCHRRDGKIHTDSTDKVVTCLLYLNEASWPNAGGRLRLLRNGSDIENALAEIPPDGGTFAAFKRSDCSWHGHLPFEGPRRYVMFNWVRSGAALSRNVLRHRVSASLKRLNPFR